MSIYPKCFIISAAFLDSWQNSRTVSLTVSLTVSPTVSQGVIDTLDVILLSVLLNKFKYRYFLNYSSKFEVLCALKNGLWSELVSIILKLNNFFWSDRSLKNTRKWDGYTNLVSKDGIYFQLNVLILWGKCADLVGTSPFS